MKNITLLFVIGFFGFTANAQTISIVGTGVNGWPPNQSSPEIMLSTTDHIHYSISNLIVTNGFVKFRQDNSWTNNWGNTDFPIGTGISNGLDIPTIAGTYFVYFNILTRVYNFSLTEIFPRIGLWGPAVDSQNGYAGQDIAMSTTDGITYSLSNFIFSSGNAYFIQDFTSTTVWGSTSFPSGIGMPSGPPIYIPGAEYFVTFNRNTGAYSFTTPSVGILGTALNGFDVPDTDMITTDGFTYSLTEIMLNDGNLKFRKNNTWDVNWGSTTFPNGFGVQSGANIPITAGLYNITFNKSNGEYHFYQLLNTNDLTKKLLKVFPNPTADVWNFSSEETIKSLIICDVLGKLVLKKNFFSNECSINASNLDNGIYFAKLETESGLKTIKLVKN